METGHSSGEGTSTAVTSGLRGSDPRDSSDRAAALADIEEVFGKFASRSFIPRLRERISDAVGGAFDPSAYPMLARIGTWGPLRTTALAEQVGLDISTVSRKVGYLEEAGLVTHASDPDDRRAHLLEITPEGRRVLSRMHKVRRALFDEALAAWSTSEIRQLADTLGRFTSALAGTA